MFCRFVFMIFLLFGFILNAQSGEDDAADVAMRPMQHFGRNLNQDLIEDIWTVTDKHRRNVFTTWWYHIGGLFSNNADDVINLHHLAGNVQHIIKVLISDDYYQHIRRCEWSQHLHQVYLWQQILNERAGEVITLRADDGDIGNRMMWDYHFSSNYELPTNLVVDRNCVNDLWSSVDIMREFDDLWQRNVPVPNELHTRLKFLERELSPYRKQRKLSFKNIRVRNEGKPGHDDDIPDSIRFDETDFLSQRFERVGIPFIIKDIT